MKSNNFGKFLQLLGIFTFRRLMNTLATLSNGCLHDDRTLVFPLRAFILVAQDGFLVPYFTVITTYYY